MLMPKISENEQKTSGERISPNDASKFLLKSHMVRYKYVQPYIQGKDVVEIGCGTCYGLGTILSGYNKIIGMDISLDALKYGNKTYKNRCLKLIQADCEALPFSNSSFDVVVSFEVIEHLADPKAYLAEISRILRRNGYFILSTPNKRYSEFNPYHLKEYYLPELKIVLEAVFDEVTILGQSCKIKSREIYKTRSYRTLARGKAMFRIGSILPLGLKKWIEKVLTGASSEEASESDFVISDQDLESASNFFAICGKR